MEENRRGADARMLAAIKEMGAYAPGGFFLCRAEEPGELIFANRALFELCGCTDEEDFRALTGFCLRGMVHPEDRPAAAAVLRQGADGAARPVYRLLRKDGGTRRVEDSGYFIDSAAYGRLRASFLTDVTGQRDRAGAVRDAVITSLTNAYITVLLIEDTETGDCSLYYEGEDAPHTAALRSPLHRVRYADLISKYVEALVAPEDRERMREQTDLAHILKRLETRERFSVNYVRLTKGGPRHYRVDFGKVRMPGGKTGVTMGFKNVDEEVRQGRAMQKALEDVRRAEEENLRLTEEVQAAARLAEIMGSVSSLLTNMPAMSFSKDAETGVYLACNQAFAEYAGKQAPEQVVGLTDHEIFDRETADHFVEDDRKALEMDSAYVFFEDVPDAAGTVIWNLQTTKAKFRDASGRLCLLGMCVDVTEMTRIKSAEAASLARQQELEQRLALQEKLLKQEAQQKELDSMITAMASDYRSVYHVDIDADDAVCYRADPDDPQQTPEGRHFPYHERFREYCRLYVAPEYQEGFLRFIDPDNVRRVLATENIMAFRYLARRGSSEYYEMLRMAGVRHPNDRDDHIVHAVGLGFTVIDEEMRRTMERNRALAEALAAAEEANKAKTAFLSNMSHEIRTPMNAIIGLNNIALADESISESTRGHLEKIGISAKHLLGIINDILDMSRIESGRMVLRSEEFSFAKTLEQVNTIISGQCREKGLHYECRVRGKIEDRYIGDDMKLRQVMINILGNAVKFTPEGGSVSFLVEEAARLKGRSTLRFVVSDTGIGMSRDFLPKLFDPFTQEESTTAGRYGSTGLGMPITKNIVEMMNGSIAVESEKGTGTTFTVTVTLLDVETPEDDGAEGTPLPHEMCVLVIDDDAVACEHARIVLGQVGVSCERALSGREGVEMVKLRHARREPYNLILVDWKMPGFDGLETTRRIRAAVGDETPIIILTSYSWEDIADEAREAGVDTFASKPLFAGTVMDEFRAAFRRKNAKTERETADLKGRRVLLAEDMPVNAEIMIMILSMREMETELAENGRIAVEMFEASAPGHYDAVLMDMRMPVMDGLEASRAIRAMDREDAKTVPIVALTANAFDEDVQRSMQAGLNAHLSKPVEPEALFETLENLIRR